MSSLTKLILMEKGRPSKVIFQFDVVHNLPTKLPQKSWMKNHFFLFSKILQSHPIATNWRLRFIATTCH